MSEDNKVVATNKAPITKPKSRAKAKAAQPATLDYTKIKDMPLKQQLALAQKNQHVLAQKYKNEKKVTVAISPLYKDYFGHVMTVKLNGIPIYIPCNNKRYEIPRSYAMEVMSRITRVDKQINREKRLADVKGNFDGQQAGGVDLIRAL